MAIWRQKERIAIGFGRDRIRVLVARGNGSLEAVYSGQGSLPEGALLDTLKAPVFGDRGVILEALRTCIAEARHQGYLRRNPELVSVVVPDGSVKLASVPIQGPAPRRAEGDEMARWALRNLWPVPAEETRTVWSIAGQGTNGETSDEWLVSLGAQEALVREYEQLVQQLEWTVGRLVPWTMAAAASAEPDSDLIVCDGAGTLACLFEVQGVPRFHRAWRARVPPEQLRQELPRLERYVNDRLEASIGRVWLCGQDEWMETAAAAATEAKLEVSAVSPEVALLGALSG